MAIDLVRLAAESIVAVTGGVQSLLKERPRPVSADDGEKAVALEEKMRRQIRAFLVSEGLQDQEHDEGSRDYWETKALLAKPIPPERLEVMAADLKSPGLAMAYQRVLDGGVKYLQDTMPRAAQLTIVGDVALEPSRIDLAAYWRCWAVGERPMVILDRLGEGILVSDEVMCLQAFYPGLYDAMVFHTIDLLSEVGGEKGEDWAPPVRKERQVEVLLGLSTLDPTFAAELQAMNEQARQSKEIRTRPLDIDVEGMKLPAQRLQAR